MILYWHCWMWEWRWFSNNCDELISLEWLYDRRGQVKGFERNIVGWFISFLLLSDNYPCTQTISGTDRSFFMCQKKSCVLSAVYCLMHHRGKGLIRKWGKTVLCAYLLSFCKHLYPSGLFEWLGVCIQMMMGTAGNLCAF